jgi:hypothetical protein
LKDGCQTIDKKRKVEHLLIKYSAVKISLGTSIDFISAVQAGQPTEVLFNSNQIESIRAAFQQHQLLVELP